MDSDAVYETYPCVICGTDCRIEVSPERDKIWMVDGCIACAAEPFYGSTVYDPLVGDPFLTVLICDECFSKARKAKKMFERVV